MCYLKNDLCKYYTRFSLSRKIIISPRDFNCIIFRYRQNPYEFLKNKMITLIPDLVSIAQEPDINKENTSVEDFLKRCGEKIDPSYLDTEDIDNKKLVNEIEIIIESHNKDQALFIANRKAQLICNFLSYKSNQPIIPTYTDHYRQCPDNSHGVEAKRKFEVRSYPEIDVTDEINSIDNNPLNDDYSHYYRAIVAMYEHSDPITAIKEFYQIIEHYKKELKDLQKYYWLRNFLSHGGDMFPRTFEELSINFPNEFDFNDRKFDYSSLRNYKALRGHSEALKECLSKFLNLKN